MAKLSSEPMNAERLARLMHAEAAAWFDVPGNADRLSFGRPVPWSKMSAGARDQYRHVARKVLERLKFEREPNGGPGAAQTQ